MKSNPMSLPKYTFGWKGAFALFLGAIIPTTLFSVINVFSVFVFKTNLQYNDLYLLLTNTILWLGAIWAFDFFVCRPQTQGKLRFDFSGKDFSTYLIVFPLMLGMMLIAEFFTALIPTTGPVFGEMYRYFQVLMDNVSNDTATLIVLAVIMAPLFEEIVFRGIIQKGLINKGVKPITAIWISSLIFGVIHGNPWQFVGAVLLGFVLGTVYEKTKSLLFPILLHAFNNLASVLLIKFYGIESFADSFQLSEYLVLGIGILLFGVFYFIFAKKYPNTTT